MNKILKPFALGACVVAMMCAADVPEAPFNLGFVREAVAGLIIAPVRRTAVVTSVAVASSTANANAAAQANANAAAQANANAAAQANAAAANANAAAAAAKSPPVGTIVTTLPPGCAPTQLNGVEYQRCGSTYYRAMMQGSNLVFVVQQP
ncbi:MAG: hypothetical protein ACRERE_45620 [Candidatus Entotheonellia bacterium]